LPFYFFVLTLTTLLASSFRNAKAWVAMHELAYRTICDHFVSGGLLQGDVDAMMAANVASFFMPHGLGHLIGLDTHDVGGYPEGAVRDDRRGFKSLRMQRRLEPGMVLTVEPGVYFIDCLLDELLQGDAQHFVVPGALERFRGTGGVRLEDSVLVTADGARNLTTCPRTVADVEAVIAGTITDKKQIAPVF
jgi:Xaa-Pro dipeptidase